MMLRSLPILREQGVETHVCCLKEEGEMACQFRDAGFPVTVVEFRSRLDPRGIWRLRRLIRREKIQILHAHMYASNMAANAVGAVMGRQVCVVNSYHSQQPLQNQSQTRMARLTSGIPRSIIAVSDAVRQPLLRAGLPEGKIRIVYNGVKLPETVEPVPDRPAGSPLHLFWAGRFVKQKRADMLIDIAAACRDAGVPIRLTLVGDGPTLPRMQRNAREKGVLDNIRFAGWTSDITPYIRENDLYITASNREGLPNTLIEVCADGRGSLVADIAPNREVLGEDGQAGVCLSDNLDDWVEAIRSIQQNRDRVTSMSTAARIRARDFSVELACHKVFDIYQSIQDPAG